MSLPPPATGYRLEETKISASRERTVLQKFEHQWEFLSRSLRHNSKFALVFHNGALALEVMKV